MGLYAILSLGLLYSCVLSIVTLTPQDALFFLLGGVISLYLAAIHWLYATTDCKATQEGVDVNLSVATKRQRKKSSLKSTLLIDALPRKAVHHRGDMTTASCATTVGSPTWGDIKVD